MPLSIDHPVEGETPRITVKVLSGGMAGLIKEFLAGEEVLIGRAPNAELRVHPTEDKTVGRRHARLTCEEGCWHIESVHRHGVWIGGAPLATKIPVQDGGIYMLGQGGPELRMSILSQHAVDTMTYQDAGGDPRRRPKHVGGFGDSPRPQRRAEFDIQEVEQSIRQESRRTLRRVMLVVFVIAAGIGGVLVSLLPTSDPLAMSGSQIQQAYSRSVFRAVSTLRLRCTHPDVQQLPWKRYWVTHGTAFAVGKRDGWVYALTNDHVFGDHARVDLRNPGDIEAIAQAVLTRWSLDWEILGRRLAEFEARYEAIPVIDSVGRTQVKTEEYEYLYPIIQACEFDQADDRWRQVIADGQFIPVQIVEAAADVDLVLFRFRDPVVSIEPLPAREVTTVDSAALAGRDVHVMGYPGVGDLPFRRSLDAINSSPSFASGVLSNIRRDDLHGGYSLQVTAPINEGNSGGPLLDEWGNVIGINTYGPSKAEAEGVNYALALGRALEWFKEHGITPEAARLPD